MIGTGRSAILAACALIAGCGDGDGQERKGSAQNVQAEAEPETVDIPQTVTAEAPGTTPMAERVAVVALLNKRNGLRRDLTMKPGQALRVGDAIVRLRACETTAPWEVQKLTGAFVQLDVRNPQNRFQRVFSGWLFKETPSLNLVEHPIYDVWPKSCAMTHPEAAQSTAPAASTTSSRSKAPNSGGSPKRKAASPSTVTAPPSAGESAEANSAR